MHVLTSGSRANIMNTVVKLTTDKKLLNAPIHPRTSDPVFSTYGRIYTHLNVWIHTYLDKIGSLISKQREYIKLVQM
jgi:hypothetical protein